MFAAMVSCRQHPNCLLPVVADSAVELAAKIIALQNGLLVDSLLAEIKARLSRSTGKYPAFLGLDRGIQIEMKIAGITPTAMARRLLANALIYHPELVPEFVPKSSSNNLAFDAFNDTLQIGSDEKRLADRIGRRTPERTKCLVIMGRMLALHTINNITMMEFADQDPALIGDAQELTRPAPLWTPPPGELPTCIPSFLATTKPTPGHAQQVVQHHL